jgi:hypothetical protein
MSPQIANAFVYGSMSIPTDFTRIKTVNKGIDYDWRYCNGFDSDMGVSVTDESKEK